MNDIKDVRFFSGGKATFTVDNGKGKHFTFRIRHRETSPFFASVREGTKYTYVGLYNPSNKCITLTRGSKVVEGEQSLNVLRWAITQVSENKELPQGYTIKHEGKCCRCGRQLTDPKSIDLGIGPECLGKAGWA